MLMSINSISMKSIKIGSMDGQKSNAWFMSRQVGATQQGKFGRATSQIHD